YGNLIRGNFPRIKSFSLLHPFFITLNPLNSYLNLLSAYLSAIRVWGLGCTKVQFSLYPPTPYTLFLSVMPLSITVFTTASINTCW
ncbi:hypothetical protein, partial [Nodularia sp. LEGE 04288]|uniref:hypothetical protein n=1 Tax=Nodularia sp. LEGE 04288 TaxID=1828639 RepID=UPI001D12E7DE